MTTSAELEAQIEKLQGELKIKRKEELSTAIAQIKDLMSQHGITVDDLQGVTKKSRKTSPLKAKYRDPASGNEWSWRGRSPKWLDGKNKNDFAV